MKIVLCLSIVVYFVCIISAIRVMLKNELDKYTTFKAMSSGFFLLIGLLSFFISKETIYFGFIPGYIFCFLGDFFLAIAKTPSGELKKNRFLFGLSSFVLAHVAFLINFGRLLGFKCGVIWLISGLIGTLIIHLTVKNDIVNFKGNSIPCYIYAFMISSFFGMSLKYAIYTNFEIYAIVLLIGSFCFMLSDSILSLKYFGVKRKRWYIVSELSLYYLGMLFLSFFTLFK